LKSAWSKGYALPSTIDAGGEVPIMNQGRTVFAQFLDLVPRYRFEKIVDRYGGNYRVRSFSCLDQFICLAFAQLTYRESLRDIQCCLNALQQKLYHCGLRGTVARSTIADANEGRDWRIYADFAHVLIAQARRLYSGEDFGIELENSVYALDSTTIDLCLSLFPWANFRQTKAAIKMHTELDLRGSIPSFIQITDGKMHDVRFLDELFFESGAIYLMDRAYLDFERLFRIHRCGAFFVTRTKRNTTLRRIYSAEVDKSTGVQCDQLVALTGFYAQRDYPEKLRRVKYFDTEHEKMLNFLTNQFNLPPLAIAELYRSRWKVETFFKWIKQHLRIKSFYGTSPNAVKTQLWIAVSVYVLVAILKKRLDLDLPLYTMLQILSVSLFEKIPIRRAFTNGFYENLNSSSRIQLNLFDS